MEIFFLGIKIHFLGTKIYFFGRKKMDMLLTKKEEKVSPLLFLKIDYYFTNTFLSFTK